MTERSSRASGGTGNAGAGAGRGGRDVGGQKDSRGVDRDFRGNLDKGKYGGAAPGDKVGRTYGVSPNRTNSLGVTTSRTPTGMQNAENIADRYNNPDFLDKFLSVLGISKVNPLTDPNLNLAEDTVPNTQLDILQALSTVAGVITGAPIGTVYGMGKWGYNQFNPEDPFEGVNVPLGNFGPKTSGYGHLPDGSIYDPERASPSATTEAQGFDTTPEPAQKSLSRLNNRIGGYSGGGYNMGAFGKKPTKKTGYLSQQLMAP